VSTRGAPPGAPKTKQEAGGLGQGMRVYRIFTYRRDSGESHRGDAREQVKAAKMHRYGNVVLDAANYGDRLSVL
jgi:hypothetical protein